jgi:short-subunit dehydrogenase
MRRPFLLDKVAIVTGASAGIGRATAFALAECGADVVLGARNEAALEEVASQIEGLGRKVLVVPTDVTQQVQVENLVNQTIAEWGCVDILVANAGQYIRSACVDLSIPTLTESMAVNFYGEVYCVLAVLPKMLAKRSGHIVLVSTMDAHTPIPPDAPYVAAKSALRGFGEVLRQELYKTGVNISMIYPGRVDTAMIEHLKFYRISAKISPEYVARSIIKAIRYRKSRVMIPPQTLILYYLTVFTPGLADFAARIFRLEGWED